MKIKLKATTNLDNLTKLNDELEQKLVEIDDILKQINEFAVEVEFEITKE